MRFSLANKSTLLVSKKIEKTYSGLIKSAWGMTLDTLLFNKSFTESKILTLLSLTFEALMPMTVAETVTPSNTPSFRSTICSMVNLSTSILRKGLYGVALKKVLGIINIRFPSDLRIFSPNSIKIENKLIFPTPVSYVFLINDLNSSVKSEPLVNTYGGFAITTSNPSLIPNIHSGSNHGVGLWRNGSHSVSLWVRSALNKLMKPCSWISWNIKSFWSLLNSDFNCSRSTPDELK